MYRGATIDTAILFIQSLSWVSWNFSLTLYWSCCFHLNNVTKCKWPFFGVLVLLSLELDSKFVRTAFSSPFMVAILQGMQENIFTSISLRNKVFSSSHPNPWYGRFCQIRDRNIWWSLTFPVVSFEQKQQEEVSAETSGFKQEWGSSVLDSFSDFSCEIVLI